MRLVFLPDRAALRQITFTFSWFGVLLMIAGFATTAYAVYWNSTALRAHATVVGIDHDNAGNKRLILRYRDSAGGEHDAKVNPVTSVDQIDGGEGLQILYHRSGPNRARLDSFMDKWFLGLFMIFWGAFLWWILGMISRKLSKNPNEANKAWEVSARRG